MATNPVVLAVIQAGGQGSRLDVLTRERAKPALSFAHWSPEPPPERPHIDLLVDVGTQAD